MAESKHTPGPWHAPHFADDATKCNCTSIVSEYYAGAICTFDVNNGKRIGEGGNDAPPLEEAKANARLIAAAPDLHYALRKLVALYGNRIGEDDDLAPSDQQHVEIAEAMEALAKTEGRS